jgi:hypothetical protein
MTATSLPNQASGQVASSAPAKQEETSGVKILKRMMQEYRQFLNHL